MTSNDLEALSCEQIPQAIAAQARHTVDAHATSAEDRALLLEILGLNIDADAALSRRCPACGTLHLRPGPRRRHQYCSTRCYALPQKNQVEDFQAMRSPEAAGHPTASGKPSGCTA